MPMTIKSYEGDESETKERMEKEEEDRRREAAMASSPCLRPNFNPKGITQHQLQKFRTTQEAIASEVKIKVQNKIQRFFFSFPPYGSCIVDVLIPLYGSADGANKKSHGDDLSSQDSVAQGSTVDQKESSFWNDCERFDSGNEDSKDDVPVIPKKQKLHWGIVILFYPCVLDTKNRWERKSNM
ncbi:unnamed protein product [Sphenostylis stenocarpa]|uniref:Uncharacterized protein n=1 Tax=Sphenostylis stenocarpa TaxID=92480 RepID=A0AA86S8P1_9FABA|nr:unnamed protein product [Sphenostylis stenocarpa]